MLNPADLRMELIYTQTGTTTSPGGQHAGSPPMAVRVTHLPTGTIAQVGDCRSQHKNRTIAMEMIQWALAEIGWVPLTKS